MVNEWMNVVEWPFMRYLIYQIVWLDLSLCRWRFFFMFSNTQFSNTKTKRNMSQHYFILTKLIKNCLWMRAICDVIWLQNEANWICSNSIRFIEFAVIRVFVGCLRSTSERHLEGVSMDIFEAIKRIVMSSVVVLPLIQMPFIPPDIHVNDNYSRFLIQFSLELIYCISSAV